MSEAIEQQGLTLEWLSVKNKAIKFQGEENIYKITDKVASLDYEKYPMKKGDKVNIKRFDNTIGYIQLADKAKFIKKNEEKKEESMEPKEETKHSEVRTIVAISKLKDFIKFADNQADWYGVSAQLKSLDFEKLGIRAKGTYRVAVDNTNMTDPIIVSIEPLEAPTAEGSATVTVVENKPTYNRNGQSNSIEKQCAYKGAIEIVVARINQNKYEKVEDIAADIKSFTQLGIDLIQS